MFISTFFLLISKWVEGLFIKFIFFFSSLEEKYSTSSSTGTEKVDKEEGCEGRAKGVQ